MITCKAVFCDDSESSLNVISSALEASFLKYGITLQLDKYTSSKVLMENVKTQKYQVIFLDIDMPELDGIQLGMLVKRLQENATIVYISDCEERVFDTFKVHPFGFIRKSRFFKDIESVVKMYVAMLNKNSIAKMLEIKNYNEFEKIPISDIIYIECEKDQQNVFLKGGEVKKIRSRMKTLEEQLKGTFLISTHQAYIVNYNYIVKINSHTINLQNGTIIPISRRKKDEVVKEFMRLSRNKKSVVSLDKSKE